jgi:uncharacterized membrane protein
VSDQDRTEIRDVSLTTASQPIAVHPSADAEDEDRRHVRDRVIFFSDAVIAIALTLLALELPVPDGKTDAAVWNSFVHQLPRDYLIFMISFVVIARLWYSHHQYFRYVHRIDPGLTVLNLLWLLMIVLLPFSTRVLGVESDLRFGTIQYAILISAVALILAAMVRHTVRRGLLHASAPPGWARSMMAGACISAVVFLLSVPVAFVNANAAKYFWLILFVAVRVMRPLTRLRDPH